MKKKGSRSQPVTRAYLSQALAQTEVRFDEQLADLEKRVGRKLAGIEEKIDRVVTVVDSVMKEVVAMRQEQTAHFHQHGRTNEKLEDHEGRIVRLEEREFA